MKSAIAPAPEPELVPTGFFVLRTPLLPHDAMRAWCDAAVGPPVVATPDCADPSLDAAIVQQARSMRAGLVALIEQPAVREALFVASPSLEASLPVWQADPDSERGQKIERALVRYLFRASFRPTPFGLFAGCSLGRVGDVTQLQLGPLVSYRRHSRLDLVQVEKLTRSLHADAQVREALTYHPNTSLYRRGPTLRYWEARAGAENALIYHLVSVESDAHLDAVLVAAGKGAGVMALVQTLLQFDGDLAPAEARAFVDELIDSQLLVSDLGPSITGPDPLGQVLQRLDGLPGTPVAERLQVIERQLRRLDAGGVGQAPAVYTSLAHALSDQVDDQPPANLVHVDLFKPATPTLGPALMREIVSTLQLLRRTAVQRRPAGLSGFRAAFRQRYGEDRFIPLLEALDQESGIPFAGGSVDAEPSPLTADIGLPGRRGESSEPWLWRDSYLLDRVSRLLREGGRKLVLDAADVEALSAPSPPPVPDALSALVTVLAAERPGGPLRLLWHAAAGPSGAATLGRFAHLDPGLEQQLRGHLDQEAARQPDAVFAEIVHLPEGRVGNVLCRPRLREHEIAYLGTPSVPRDRQLRLAELRLGLVDGELRLYSDQLRREVIPRLTNAHSYVAGLPLYRFLCELQQEAEHYLWDWGPLQALSVLPRVCHGNTILALGRWRLSASDLAPLLAASGAARFRCLARLREQFGLPDQVSIADGDQVMPVDLTNVLSVEAAVHVARRSKTVELVERCPLPDELVVTGPEGRFCNEIIVPLVKRTGDRLPLVAPQDLEPGFARALGPGSECLFLKFYAGPSDIDRLLTDVLEPLVLELGAQGRVTSWFFIRYGDPDWHLRLRLFGDAAALTAEVLSMICARVAAAALPGFRMQIDTYDREIERYGGPDGMLLAEAMFHADSVAAVAALRGQDAGGRALLAFAGIHALFDDAGLTLAQRIACLESMRDGLAAEFAIGVHQRRQLGDKFRKLRFTIEAAIQEQGAAFSLRSRELGPLFARLRALAAAGRLRSSVPEFVGHLVHMFVNRLLRSGHRAQELVLYDLLGRHYVARRQQAAGAQEAAHV